jgi:hypothetical protein
LTRVLAVGTAGLCLALASGASAQTRAKAGGASPATVARTPWGDPDLQGVWTNSTTTPLERSDKFANKPTLTNEERAALDADDVRNADRPPAKGSPGNYNDFWFDRGKRSDQTSLIVDPPDGKFPSLTPQGQKVQDAQPRPGPPASPEDLSLFERCITRSMPGAMLPGFYNHNYQILQTPGYVVILVEMIHDARIIPMDGQPHAPPNLQRWLGDSRGHWEGNTLVVETTNVRPAQPVRPGRAVFGGGGEKFKVVERFTRVDANTLDYQFTVTDPDLVTRPWTVSTPMSKIDAPIFEYACHEGNHSAENMLRGARQAEQETGEASKR